MKKKAIAVILTDTHLDNKNHEVNEAIYRHAIKEAKKRGLSHVEHAGDLFDSRKAQTQDNLNALGRIFDMFAEEKITLNVVVGNHDKTEYSIAESFLDVYKHHPFINIYSEPANGRLEGSVFINYAPFFTDEEYVKRLPSIERKKSKGNKTVLITHIGVNGAKMNNGTVIETSVTPSLFKYYDLTLIGHYHDPQSLSDKIKYIGASLQHNFGEQPSKGITILYDDLSIETLESGLPQYVAYKIDAKDLTLKDIEDIRETAATNGDKLRIVLTGSKAEISVVDKQRLLAIGVDVATEEKEIIEEEVEEATEAFTDQSLLEIFKEFCKKNSLDYKRGIKYLNKAINV